MSAKAAVCHDPDAPLVIQDVSTPLDRGFIDHGPAVPISNARGIVAAKGPDGRDTALVWLFDHTGGYALLMIDAETGESRQVETPWKTGGDCPYSSILSRRNRYYTHFGGHFAEFDPEQCRFTMVAETVPQMAMGMTEDDNGQIWSVSYPQSGVACYDPQTGEFIDYGQVHRENWAQYQRSVATDDGGWLYFGIGHTATQIVAFDPRTRKTRMMIPQRERGRGSPMLYRGVDGAVYGTPLQGTSGDAEIWYRFHDGDASRLEEKPSVCAKAYIAGSQALFHRTFPSGRKIRQLDLRQRTMVCEDPQSGGAKSVEFDYETAGAHGMSLCHAPDGTVAGGTAFPMSWFAYDPTRDTMASRPAYGQFNTVASQGDRLFVGGYGGGFLLEWNPAEPWKATIAGDPESNPLHHLAVSPAIHRPHVLLPHPDGETLVMGGTPQYGYTGGGLLIWNRRSCKYTLLEHTDLVPDCATTALAPLPNAKLLGGTTVAAGTGGEQKANEAELYILDLVAHDVVWRDTLLPGTQRYWDLLTVGPDCRIVVGVADKTFFVFDPVKVKILMTKDLEAFGGFMTAQGARGLIEAPDRMIYALMRKAIVRIDPRDFSFTRLGDTPVPVTGGIALVNGRLYFIGGSHLYSAAIPD